MSFEVSSEIIDKIKDRTDLVRLIGSATVLTQKGREWSGCCPFHNEKTPSFRVRPERNDFRCYGCGTRGDAIDWMVRKVGMAWGEAVEALAAQAGVELVKRELTPAERGQKEARDGILAIQGRAQTYFRQGLLSGQGRLAREYLVSRGITGDDIERFGIGYARNVRQGFVDICMADGLSASQLVNAGLARQANDGTCFDLFRDRITFPIHDRKGVLIAFGGRILTPTDNLPKYLNSPETPIFKKQEHLYSHHRVATDTGQMLVLEGYLDVVGFAKVGFNNAVATMGTAITPGHLQQIWKLGYEPVICMDGDVAGLKAAVAVMNIALPLARPNQSVSFAFMPFGLDPFDLAKQSGDSGVMSVLSRAMPLHEFLWQTMEASPIFDRPDGMAKARKMISEMVSDMDVRQEYLKMFEARAAYRYIHRSFPVATGTMSSGAVRTTEMLLTALINHPLLIPEFAERLADVELHGPHAEIKTDFITEAERLGMMSTTEVIADLFDEQRLTVLNFLNSMVWTETWVTGTDVVEARIGIRGLIDELAGKVSPC